MFSVRHLRVKPVLVLSGVSATVYYSFGLFSDRPVPLPLSPSRFTPSTLVESVNVSSNTKLLTLSVPPGLLPSTVVPIYSVFIKDSDIQVERPYTPLEGIDENGHIKFWIKKYEHGEVGRWLHSRQVGDPIEIRGPVQTWSTSWQNGHWDHIVMARTSIPFSLHEPTNLFFSFARSPVGQGLLLSTSFYTIFSKRPIPPSVLVSRCFTHPDHWPTFLLRA